MEERKTDPTGTNTFTPEWSPHMPASAATEKGKDKKSLGPDHPKVKFLAMATLVIISGGAGFLGGWLGQHSNTGEVTTKTQQVVLKSQGDLIRNIAKTVGESVVSVNTTTTVAPQASFFGYSQGGQQEGAGTGIILTEGGLIITNRHVVPAGTDKVTVTLSDGTELDNVSVVGRTSDQDSLDVAFLQVNDLKGKKLHAATIGDSSKVQVGDSVIAIGNALGQFQNTVTSGILSGYGRSVQASDSSGDGTENLEDMFQTDAAINEGNSGGPLVNIDGQVVGINTAVAGGGAENIGFSIPINDVTGLIASVKATGKLQRPYLGVVYVPLTNDIAKQYNLSVSRGAYIPSSDQMGSNPIIADGPAAKAGIKEGDIITKIDDDAVDQSHSLSSLVNKHAVGDKVTVTILRDGKEVKLSVTLGPAPTS